MKEKIELHLAFMWDCPECGIENFCRSIVADEYEEAEMREEHGIEPWELGKWHTAPLLVTCKACGAEFEPNYGYEWEG